MQALSKKEQIIAETKLLVKLFLETNKSDIDLGKETGISSSTVGRRLTNKEVILIAFPEKGEYVYNLIRKKRKENLERGKVLGSQVSSLNNMNDSSNVSLKLDSLFSKEKNKIMFLSHLALYFRAKLPLLEELFGYSKEELIEKIYYYNSHCHESFEYLFNEDDYNQEIARINIINFFRDYVNAIIEKDFLTKNSLIKLIDDSSVSEFFLNHKKTNYKTDEEMLLLINYQLKYAMSNKKMEEKFKFAYNGYIRRARSILQNYPELLERYEKLINYYAEKAPFYNERSIEDEGRSI